MFTTIIILKTEKVKKSILNIGESLTRKEQKQIHGCVRETECGDPSNCYELYGQRCSTDDECQPPTGGGDYYQCQHGHCL